MKLFKNRSQGMSLLEVLLAVAVFAIGIGTVIHLYLGTQYASLHSIEKNQALTWAKEGIEAVRSIKDDDFDSISEKTDEGIEINGGVWAFKTGSDVIDEKYTRRIDITETDSDTWEVTATVSWDTLRGKANSVSLVEQLTAWKEPYFIEYDLTINSTTGGSVTTPGEGTYINYYEDVVDIIAEADETYVFTEWTGDIENIATTTSATTTITIYDDHSITANFEAE
jgi:prepilin-type N-terminal cleavage/methylation domain-containing protein